MVIENDATASKLDSFLNEWDKQAEEKKDSANTELLARVNKLEEDNKELRQKTDVHDKTLETEVYKEEIKPVIATVGSDTGAEARTVHGWLNEEADKDPKLRDAWNDREKNPEAFDKMIEGLAPKFKEYIQKEAKNILDVKGDDPPADPPADPPEDKDNKADRSASHASRIARNANAVVTDDYEKVDWAGLGDNEFARMSEKVFADMRNGTLKPE